MLLTRQNRLLPILAVVMLLILLLVVTKACRRAAEEAPTLAEVPAATRPDADTPADTIETLTANVAAMTAELEQLRATNNRLKIDQHTLADHKAALEQELDTRIQAALATHEGPAASGDREALARLRERVDALSDALSSGSASGFDEDVPIGLGLPTTEAGSEFVWIEPLDHSEPGVAETLVDRVGRQPDLAARRAEATAVQPVPVYTVPRNATLLGATAMTALIGRVPVHGEVRDPMPFKVITGRDNLAANGLMVPGVHGMIWSGTAIGDWTLSCVTGRLESVTFVFDDGTIRTQSMEDRDPHDSRQANKPLGWISDAHGIPCISGERKSNAAAFLSQRIGVKAMQAAAQAAAAAETTTVLRDSGSISNSVNGDKGDYVLGKTLADASSEVAAWLAERQTQNFDAVFVPAGGELAIHVDRELAIDRDPNGRKLAYDTTTQSTAAHPLD